MNLKLSPLISPCLATACMFIGFAGTKSLRAANSDSTVELSPFVVNAEDDNGYVATNTLAGSRLNTSLRDTAASISVMTSQLLADLGVTDLTEAIVWSTNSQLDMQDTLALSNGTDDINSTFSNFNSVRVRGISATKTRNYFRWDMPSDTYNIERIEEARGPNSVLFGIGSAGGVVNSSTKRATLGRNFRKASVGISSHEGYRGTVDVNQKINSRMAVRLNGVYHRSNGARNYTYDEKRFAHLAFFYAIDDATRLRAEYETGLARGVVGSNMQAADRFSRWTDAGRPVVTAPLSSSAATAAGVSRLGTGHQVYYIGNGGPLSGTVIDMAGQYRSSGTDYVLDPSVVPYQVATGGPGTINRQYFDTWTVTLERQFGRHTFLELAYNHQQYHKTAWQPATDSYRLWADPNATLANGQPNPNVGRYMLEGQSWEWIYGTREDNTRVMLAHELDLGKWGKYRFGGMGEHQWRSPTVALLAEAWADAPFNSAPENSANLVRRRNYVNPGDWDSYYRTMPPETGLIHNLVDPVTGRELSSTMVPYGSGQVRDFPEYQDTWMITTQARYFRDRLVLGLGYREDSLKVTTRGAKRDPVTNYWTVDYSVGDTSKTPGRTKTAGAVYHVTSNVSLFANYSDNFNPAPVVFLVPDGHRASNPMGKGKDAGIAVTLLDGKVYARVNYFQTNMVNGANSNYGGSTTAPSQIGNQILDALVDNGKLSAAEADKWRVTNTGSTYSQLVKGYEVNLTANPTKNWRLQANFSYTDGYTSEIAPEVQEWAKTHLPYFKTFDQDIVTSKGLTIGDTLAEWEEFNDQQVDLVGLVLPGNRKYKVNVFTTYSFSETLKGLRIGGGYRHLSKMPIGRYPSDLTIQYGPSYWDSNLMVGYRFAKSPIPWLKRLDLQLNVQNVFDIDDAYVYRRTQDTPEINKRIRIREPRTWRLTANFDF